MTSMTANANNLDTPKHGFWRRRIVAPIKQQLTQGVTPQRVTYTLGVGTVCSLLPFLGFTSLLNLGVGVALRLNQPLLQVLNQLLGPIQLLMILVYVRGGELVWGATENAFSVTAMISSFAELSFAEFIQTFGWAGVHAFTAWLLTAPLLFALVYLPLRPLIERLAQLRDTSPSASTS
ncbi:MAG: DUF2062 domain-containing protein [Opitutaceae bacterium]|nr:DUF2062 domain-containing protein [Opitutaceae bacterium]